MVTNGLIVINNCQIINMDDSNEPWSSRGAFKCVNSNDLLVFYENSIKIRKPKFNEDTTRRIR